MAHLTISQLRQKAAADPYHASFDAQLERRVERQTRGGKPFYEMRLVDASADMKLKVWENLPQFEALQKLDDGVLLRISGEWTQNQYGMDSTQWEMRLLTEAEGQEFLAGDPETRQRQLADWEDIVEMTGSIGDPRLQLLCHRFIERYGARFRRTAAARKNHHARRGGLVEHVAQMMRAARALCAVYPDLNRDLLTAGVLFHDCGKMWENSYPDSGFTQPYHLHGEMLGHIPLGIEVANAVWREIQDELDAWKALQPESEQVHLHLLHLIASHHGTYEWGSPTLPRTPEAVVLHHVDNLDAKFEMMRMGYASQPELAPGVQERQFPLPANLVQPLPHFGVGLDDPDAEGEER